MSSTGDAGKKKSARTASRAARGPASASPELPDGEARFRQLFENAPVGIYVTTPDGRILEANPALVRMLGYASFAELSARNLESEFETSYARSDFKSRVERDGSVTGLEATWTRKDGETIVVRENARVILGPTGDIVAYEGTVEDISDLKRAERELEERVAERAAMLFESEMRFQSVVESASDAIVLADETGAIASWNGGAAALFGYSESEVMGKPLTILMPERYRESHDRGMEQLAATGQSRVIGRVMEMHAVTADGREFPVEISLGTWSVEGRTFYSGILRDISDRKRSEAESESMRALIERSAREWQRTLDVIAFPILLVDGDARILRLNRTARDLLLAPTYGDVLGHRLDDVAGVEPWATATQLVRSMTDEPAGGSRNVSVLASRRAWDVEATIWTRAEAGETRIVLLVRDVTATVRLQESLRRTETMAAIGAVVASVAHEVRTPLFSIGATVDAFEAEFRDYEDQFSDYHGVLRRQVDRLSKLMEDLLEYGKPLAIAQAPESVPDLVSVAVDLCSGTAASRGVNVRVRTGEHLPLASVDRARSIQVLQNLIENAIQFSAAGDTVDVVVSAFGRSDGDWIMCRVLDSGPGFAEADLGRVFEPFYTKRSGGTGLGLSIVQRIVDQHGGVVYAENRPRGGACLTVLLPQELAREDQEWPSTES